MTSPLRVLKQIVKPVGRHRPHRHVPAIRAEALLDENEPVQSLDDEDAAANECAPCPACQKTTFHAMYRDGSRRCWTCNTTTEAE